MTSTHTGFFNFKFLIIIDQAYYTRISIVNLSTCQYSSGYLLYIWFLAKYKYIIILHDYMLSTV